MPIPDYQSIMLPILKFLGDKQEHPLNEIIEHMYKISNLMEEEKRRLLPSGQEPIFRNRIRWARFYLEKAGLVESPRRAFSKITDKGLDVLREKPSKLSVKYLGRFPEFVEFKTRKKGEEKEPLRKSIVDSLDPMELLENAYQKIKGELGADLLKEIQNSSPRFFEDVVVGLLVKMGYGGSRKDAGQAIGKCGDEGIDGIIKEDRLGLDAIYIQAKRWKGTVGRSEIQNFVGALKGQGANKGVFITTSNFSKKAEEYASKIGSPKIVLIDGPRLAELMIEYNIGVSQISSYEVKKIDSDFFSED